MSLSPLEEAAELIEAFGAGSALRARIADLESAGVGLDRNQVKKLLADKAVGENLVAAAVTVKSLAGQINTVMHAAGILVSLPWILEPGEVVESLSLGAGNTGRDHDLETDRRIAEFKFINWRQSSNTMRQNSLFADVFSVASASTDKRRIVYVLGTEQPLKFLLGRRAISSVLSRSSKVGPMFYEFHGNDTFKIVRESWATVRNRVELVDLSELVPCFSVE